MLSNSLLRKINYHFWYTPLLLLFLVVGCSQSPSRVHPVGRDIKNYVDSERKHWKTNGDRPLNTVVWYPAQKHSHEKQWEVGVFIAGRSAFKAPIIESPAKLPLIVLSHGTGGASAQLSWLAEKLAANGFFVASVNHHGNTAIEENYLAEGFALWWERATDLSIVIDKLLSDPGLGQHIDPEKIGAAGFSLGGYSVLALAGAKVDLEQLKNYCLKREGTAECSLPPEAKALSDQIKDMANTGSSDYKQSLAKHSLSYADPRIKSVFSIAPVHGQAMIKESLIKIKIPVNLIVGTEDKQAKADINAQFIHTLVPKSKLTILPEVGHYSFLAPCSFKGKRVLADLCKDAGRIERKDVHKQISEMALAFFRSTL